MIFADNVIDPSVLNVPTWLGFLTAFAVAMGFLSQALLAFISYLKTVQMAKAQEVRGVEAAKAVSMVAEKAEEVKQTLAQRKEVLDDKLTNLTNVTNATHTLVNSRFEDLLNLNAVMAKRIADITKDPDDVNAAKLAIKLLNEHRAKQAAVDAVAS